MFGKEDVKELIECAKRALEAEDRYLESCFDTRHWKGSERGICDNVNERYYQFVIWHGLMSSFRWRPKTERQGYDLAFYDDTKSKLVAYAEIKGWWSESGEAELQGIKRDLKGKLGIAPVPGVMLILTCQLTDLAKHNFDWLAEQLGVSRTDMETASFRVSTKEDGDWEFAIIGFLVTPSA